MCWEGPAAVRRIGRWKRMEHGRGCSPSRRDPRHSAVDVASRGFTGWMTGSMTFTATSASELLEFVSLGAPSGQPPVALLDGVSLTGLTGAAPEPGTWAMMGLGFAGLGLVAYRRRRKAPSRSADLKPKSEQDRGRPLAAAAEANALVTFK
jgi:hypothetical protein